MSHRLPVARSARRARGALRRHGARLFVAALLLLAAADAAARAGGGHSSSGGSSSGGSHSSGGGYSGGSHSFGGGYSGGGDIDGSVVLLLIFVVIVIVVEGQRARRGGGGLSTGSGDALAQPASDQGWARGRDALTGLETLRREDPDFSETLFLDFVAAIAARAVTAAGTPRVAALERYLAGPRALLPFAAGPWQNVVVGGTQLRSASVGPEGSRVTAEVAIGASSPSGGRWWRTAWTFTRRPGVRSKGPGEITRLACPACGGGSDLREDGACRYCGQRPSPGEAAWAVATVMVLQDEPRPPIALGGYAEEVGTDLPTLRSPTLAADLAALPQQLPGFDWRAGSARFEQVFLRLQQAWSDRDLAALRPITTDAIFSTWRYWIEAYRAAGLRNRLDRVQVARIEPARVSLDRYYAAVTVRISASMVDQTVDDGGRVVDGRATPREFTEYWTFVRTLSAAKPEGVSCAGCGASLPAGQTGQCPYCGSLVGAPAFDWILSRIDQDEDYSGT
jgi:predicted lipid-binding transport protein (Tim44 family)